jgi:hypothetical protein
LMRLRLNFPDEHAVWNFFMNVKSRVCKEQGVMMPVRMIKYPYSDKALVIFKDTGSNFMQIICEERTARDFRKGVSETERNNYPLRMKCSVDIIVGLDTCIKEKIYLGGYHYQNIYVNLYQNHFYAAPNYICYTKPERMPHCSMPYVEAGEEPIAAHQWEDEKSVVFVHMQNVLGKVVILHEEYRQWFSQLLVLEDIISQWGDYFDNTEIKLLTAVLNPATEPDLRIQYLRVIAFKANSRISQHKVAYRAWSRCSVWRWRPAEMKAQT